jgi:hypothetical protein
MNHIPGIIIVDGMNRNDSESVEVLRTRWLILTANCALLKSEVVFLYLEALQAPSTTWEEGFLPI